MSTDNLEEEILIRAEFEGLSSAILKELIESLDDIKIDFITDLLSSYVNLNINPFVLVDFLPHIWNKNNSSVSLLLYISGIAHKAFYLAREYPLGKELPVYLKEDILKMYEGLQNFVKSCGIEVKKELDEKISVITSFKELIQELKTTSRFQPKLNEILCIISKLFLQFVEFTNQEIRTLDELVIYVSRCLIFWKLKMLSDKKLEYCLKGSMVLFSGKFDSNEFEKLLSLEIQNYQFLQMGITHSDIKLITKVYKKISGF